MEIKEFVNQIKKYIFPIAILVLVAVCISIYIASNDNESLTSSINVQNEKIEINNNLCEIFVDISGAVKSPNVYCFKSGSLVIDAIKKAGGFKTNTYAKEFVNSTINLARVLENNEKVYIPFKNEVKFDVYKYELVKVERPSNDIKEEEKACISINKASTEELDSLNGVGPSLAQKIIVGRPYKSVNDLNNVSGIGDSLFEKIKDSVCI